MMQERRQIVRLARSGTPTVLATLIAVQGSSYRRAGARLLISAEGRYAGAISGGCLEAELIRRAQWSVRHGAVVQRFSMALDDTADIPYGLGCGGTVDVLLEPSGTAEFATMIDALERSLQGEWLRVRTWLPQPGGGIAAQPARTLRREVSAAAPQEPVGMLEEAQGCVVESLGVPQRLVLCGAGDDARPLVRLGALLGWDVVVVDGRQQWARAERFPEALRVETVTEPGRFLLRAEDAVVVMTHSFEQDGDWLRAALQARARYVGLLGARHRSALLIQQAAQALGWPLEQVCAQVFAPVGLDLGGDGAEAIALAVAAEVQARLQGKLGLSQRMPAALVAELCAQGDSARYQQAQCAL